MPCLMYYMAGTLARKILCTVRTEDTTVPISVSASRKGARCGTKFTFQLADALRRLWCRFLNIIVSLVLIFHGIWQLNRSESAAGDVR